MEIVFVEAVLMDNGELISCGKTLGWKKDFEHTSLPAVRTVEEMRAYLSVIKQ